MSKFSVVARISAALLAILLLVQSGLAGPAPVVWAAAPVSGNTFVVNTTLDTPDADVLNPTCADSSGRCSLRAAIMLADFLKGSSTIILPADVYKLTRPGYDNNSEVGDLDISANMAIQGAGSGVTIVDGNGAVTGDRAFKVLATAGSVTLSGLTIRNGVSLSSTVGTIGGGGLLMEGAGNLSLSDVAFEDNTAQNGGGLYTNFTQQGGSLSMDNVILHANKALAGGVGAGGGLFVYFPSASSQATVQNSLVYSNTADGTGGGIFIEGNLQAHWQVEGSQFYLNNAASGGAIGNFIPLTLSDSVLHNNHVSFDGGAIEAFSPVSILRSMLNANSAGRYGGAIFSLSTGSSTSPKDFLDITQSTLSGNYAHDGGAIYHDGFIDHNALLTLTNSTLSGNGVNHYGGGLNVYQGKAQLFNDTIADNHVTIMFLHPQGIGGGLYITATSTLTVENTIIADNWRGNGIIIPTPDDCYSLGTTGQLGFSLITTMANCFITGAQVGNITGQEPLLGPLMSNGGETFTQAIPANSPAIDAGATLGCSGAGGVPLTIDQRGYVRPYGANCDIGAFEYNPNTSVIYAPIMLR